MDYTRQASYGQASNLMPATSSPKEANPDAFTNRLKQLLHGLNNATCQADEIGVKLWGPTPQSIENAANATSEPSVSVLLDMLQARASELQQRLQGIVAYL